jgi:ribosome-associated toxin RatA of RatAB toxin-antitoxin module
MPSDVRTRIDIDVSAPPRRVFDLARDIARWPELLPHYRKVTVHSRDAGRVVATMVATRRFGPLGVPVRWRTTQWSDDSDPSQLRLRFTHLSGPTRGMEVTWRIEPRGKGSEVSIEHSFTRRLPLLGWQPFPAFIDRWFVRPIAGRTLARFKALAEDG